MTKEQSNYQKKYNFIKLFKDACIPYSMFSGSICYTANKHHVYVNFSSAKVAIQYDQVGYVALKDIVKNNLVPQKIEVNYSTLDELIFFLYSKDLLNDKQLDSIMKVLKKKIPTYQLFHKVLLKRINTKAVVSM